MIERLHSNIRLLAHQPGASPVEIAAFQARYPDLPAEFLELMGEATDVELSYCGRYLRLYGPAGCVEMDEAYAISSRIPQAITVGDNGGGEAIVFVPGRGLHRVGYGALFADELVYIARTLDDLLVQARAHPEAVGGCEA